ncbi:MAG: hypothetical protein NTZ25_04845 [Candidatus Peregrinibacteria bacterium]|nr:hypothetical protein [Candidatus Peregrinibacteria bacterium]
MTIFIYAAPVTHSQELNTTNTSSATTPAINMENYSPWQRVEISDYISQEGDYLTVYIPTGTAYLANDTTKIYAQFPILSGQPRNVHYIGRYYFAATPEQEWEVKSMDTKKDRVTFGKTGRFFRLYEDGNSTPYGIHGYKYAAKLIEGGKIYASMGCVIVPEEVLDIIDASFKADVKDMKVITTSDIQKISNFIVI